MPKLHPDLENKEFQYKDITLIPFRLPDFERDEVDLTSHFTKHIKLKVPLVSAPMDSVTGAEMAILMALQGGIGAIHYNFQTIDEQIEEVGKVKRFEAGGKNEMYPLATKDENKRLRVFIAVESRMELAKERINKACEAGVDGIIIDAGIVFKEQIEIAKYCKENFPNLEVILGNIGSGKMVETIIKQASDWCDGLRIGIGPGAACITLQELGTGRAQASAVWDCAQTAKWLETKYGFMPIIADGGIRIPDLENDEIQKPGDITKALALGGQTVMMGGLLAGLEESPPEKEFDYEENRMIKKYWGMGSPEAMAQRAGVRYGIDKLKIKIPEGRVIKVPYRGSGYDFLPKLVAGVKQSLQKQGFKNIKELQEGADIRLLPD